MLKTNHERSRPGERRKFSGKGNFNSFHAWRSKANFKLPLRTAKIFTLIELCIVIAVIAILVSMLLPALSNVREKVKGIACAGNLRQCGTALSMYTDDFSGWIPPYMLDSYGYSGASAYWMSFLISGRYLSGADNAAEVSDSKYMNVIRCPALPIIATKGSNGYNYAKTYGIRTTYNYRLTPTVRFWKIQKEQPSIYIWLADTVFMGSDTNYRYEQSSYFDGGFNLPDRGNLTKNATMHLRHNNTANCWFLDNHVTACSGLGLKDCHSQEKGKGTIRVFSKDFIASDL